MKFFDHAVRIRYGETDKMGVSYYANYLVWFEASRSELFRALGVPYTDIEKKGLFLPVVEVSCKYFHPTDYDELIYIRVSVSRLKVTSMQFTYQVINEARDRIMAWGSTTHVFVDCNKKPARIPQEIKDVVTLCSLSAKDGYSL